METVRRYSEPYDAVIQAGYGEHGREGLQELVEVVVVDITEAAASTAQFLGRRYSVVTTLDRAVPLIEDRLKLAGLTDRCASVRASGVAVLDLEADPALAVKAIVAEAALAVSEDHAEVICLGCGGMAGLTEQVAARTRVPVVDGVAAAVTIAESLVRLGPAHLQDPHLRTPRTEDVPELAAALTHQIRPPDADPQTPAPSDAGPTRRRSTWHHPPLRRQRRRRECRSTR